VALSVDAVKAALARKTSFAGSPAEVQRHVARLVLKAEHGYLALAGPDIGYQGKGLDEWRAAGLPSSAFEVVAVAFHQGGDDETIAALEHCPKLESLAIGHSGSGDPRSCPNITAAGLKQLQGFARLVSFQSQSDQVTDEAIAFLRQCPELKHLTLRNSQVTDRGLNGLRLPKLQDFCGPKAMTDEGLAEIVKAAPDLTSIELHLSFKASAQPLTKARKLRHLHCTGFQLTPRTAGELSELPEFAELDLTYLNAPELSATLKPLDKKLRRVMLRDDGQKNLPPKSWEGLFELNAVESLQLDQGMGVDDDALLKLAALKTLKSVVINGQPGMTRPSAAAIETFGKARPEIELKIDDKPYKFAARPFTVREAVEWIINNKNGVTLADGQLYSDIKSLPAGELTVVGFGLGAIEPGAYEPMDEDLAKLKCLTDVERVLLVRTKVTSKGLQTLSEFAPKITFISITSSELDDQAAEALTRFPRMQDLEIKAPRVTHAGFKHLAAIPALTALGLWETKVSAEDLKAFAPKLEYLLVGNTYKSGDYFEKGALEELKNFDRLQTFHSHDGQVRDEDLPSICQIPNLTRLHLANQKFTDKGLRAFSNAKHLSELSLERNSGISDDGMDALAASGIASLGLSSTAITDAGLKKLAANKDLRFLGIRYCPGITQDGIDAFHAAVPGCTITWDKGEVQAE
jgi:Leucine-rich repeat (LRR) protein